MYKINLLPLELQRDLSIDVKGLVKRVSITVTIILLLASYGVFLYLGYLTQREIADTQRYLNQITPAVKKVEAIKTQRVKDEESIKVYQGLLSARLTRFPLLEDLNHNMPFDLWLENVDISYVASKDAGKDAQPGQPATTTQAAGGKNGPVSPPLPNTLVLEGYARSVPSIGFFVNNLYRMPYFSSVVLNEYEYEKPPKDRYKFKLTAALKEGGR
ncbi:MAG: PilN domain-containing protein [Desulfotomaculaceae bacterium]|nr:PilN domain-containing protein [Desulfotomaculaceae bacterium]